MRPSPTAGTIPVHYRIADAIRAQILSGELKPGDSLPTIAALCEQWGCAPMTVKAGLAVLRGEGRITGGRGVPAKIQAGPDRITLALDEAQREKDRVLLSAEERARTEPAEVTAGLPTTNVESRYRYTRVPAGTEIGEEFGVEPGTELRQRDHEVVARDTGRRLALSVSFIPIALIEENPELLDETLEPWPGGRQHQLFTVGIEIDQVVRSIIAITPTPGDRQAWGMRDGYPLLRVRSRSIDVDGRCVEVSDALYPSDRTEIQFTNRLQPLPADR